MTSSYLSMIMDEWSFMKKLGLKMILISMSYDVYQEIKITIPSIEDDLLGLPIYIDLKIEGFKIKYDESEAKTYLLRCKIFLFLWTDDKAYTEPSRDF